MAENVAMFNPMKTDLEKTLKELMGFTGTYYVSSTTYISYVSILGFVMDVSNKRTYQQRIPRKTCSYNHIVALVVQCRSVFISISA